MGPETYSHGDIDPHLIENIEKMEREKKPRRETPSERAPLPYDPYEEGIYDDRRQREKEREGWSGLGHKK